MTKAFSLLPKMLLVEIRTFFKKYIQIPFKKTPIVEVFTLWKSNNFEREDFYRILLTTKASDSNFGSRKVNCNVIFIKGFF